ncbi:MAG: phosphoribosylanthranilate isomerase [Solobacterium sp.]|nr:phosphoribosylanthranilate isomerase [Solobacterium sp.]
MTVIKLCGLCTKEDAIAAGLAKPDIAGMILSSGFRRSITEEKARSIRKALDQEIALAGVFVNEPAESIISFVRNGIIDLVQLHGTEDEACLQHLRTALPGITLIKAFRIQTAEDLRNAEQSSADRILLDGGTGEGKTFDWRLLQGCGREYILAGGLTPENVQQAIAFLHPYGVDTSSGIETGGRKDPEKMKAFVRAVREEEKRK